MSWFWKVVLSTNRPCFAKCMYFEIDALFYLDPLCWVCTFCLWTMLMKFLHEDKFYWALWFCSFWYVVTFVQRVFKWPNFVLIFIIITSSFLPCRWAYCQCCLHWNSWKGYSCCWWIDWHNWKASFQYQCWECWNKQTCSSWAPFHCS